MQGQHRMTEQPQQKRVLVVDDDSEVRRIITVALQRRALVVDTATNGREALELLQQNTYSVVLLDLLMPGTDGFAVLKKLSDPDVSSPVILVVTGAERSVIDSIPGSSLIHGIVRKPFDPDELATLVVACADIKARNTFGTMAIATMIAGGPLIAWLNRLSG